MSAERGPDGDRWSPVVWVEPWNDPHTEAAGVAVRSPYVEKYWTSVLGPTQVLLLRHVADQFDRHPDGFEMRLADASVQLGVSPAGGKGALRAFYRLERFRLAAAGHSLWAVRRSVPVLSRQHLLRLPDDLRASHSKDAGAAAAVWSEQAAERAGHTALLLARRGESAESIARRLEAMRVPPRHAQRQPKQQSSWSLTRSPSSPRPQPNAQPEPRPQKWPACDAPTAGAAVPLTMPRKGRRP